MSDVFISYARSTAAQANTAAQALRTAGYSVWLDEDLPAHRPYAREIETQLDQAKAALVIWSVEAAQSEWVLSEANRAREARKLVQVSVDGVRLPMPFDQIQCADLAGWSGDLAAPGWRKVVASVSELAGAARPRPPELGLAAPPARPSQPGPLLAVLAFDNLSGDPEMAFFSDGLSEEILDAVSRGSDLKVIARSSSFQFRGADKAVRRVAADLGATHLLDGSVRRADARVRILAQLVDCRSETALWSKRFDRDLQDVFSLQDEIAQAVAEAMKTAFAPARPTWRIDPAAYELYLKAKDQGLGAQNAGLALAQRVRLLEDVVAASPEFAPGWAWLGQMRALTARRAERGAAFKSCRAAALEALAVRSQ